ncbi:MAG: CCA tRNA nucleotidyltransferase [Coprobacillus sp.]|nr:CCA tRNA nucleotidyltransferase [Coprobacillus sp.]
MDGINFFLELTNKFKDAGYSFFMVGGTVRDFIMYKEVGDYDIATDATPDEVVVILKDYSFDASFKKYGVITLKKDGIRYDIVTFRKEFVYTDYRHPAIIEYVKSMEEDVVRRDFTINGLYMDDRFKIYDFVGGQKDIENKVIRTIGDPRVRITEDPLRILRAIRFSLTLGFSIDPDLEQAIKDNVGLLHELNPEKIRHELSKFKKIDYQTTRNVFRYFSIDYLLGESKI